MSYSLTVSKFEKFFDQFRQTEYWKAMENTKEDSPWHREDSVAEHTNMLLRWYRKNIADSRTPKQQMLSMISCLFHDVGKPPAKIEKFSEERGRYFAFHGHEQISARLWVDYALQNRTQLVDLGLNSNDVSNIAFMIEHHVPFAMKDKNKRSALKQSLLKRMGEAGHQAWLDFLMSDQHGRISDNQDEKLANVAKWMMEWKEV